MINFDWDLLVVRIFLCTFVVEIKINNKTFKVMKDLDWSNLSFGYRPTDYNVRCYYRNGKWGEIEVCSEEYIHLQDRKSVV